MSSEMDLRTIFAANLVRLRRAKGVSQQALTDKAEIDRSYLSRVEAAHHCVGLEVIGKLAEALEVEPAELLKLPPKRTLDRA
jgi:transcriptional regulator with XRE-family HTH domain